MSKRLDLIGQSYGRLTVQALSHINKQHRTYWKCVCSCGAVAIARGAHLLNGNIRSCGCFAKECTVARSTTHGMTHMPTYSTWRNMINRCHNPNNPRYADYGGRGITVCRRWRHSPRTFLADMGIRPKSKSLDRIDNDAGYCPSNCRWATRTEQANNARSNIKIAIGAQTYTLAEWCRITGIKKGTVYSRRYLGWAPDKALFVPMRRIRRQS